MKHVQHFLFMNFSNFVLVRPAASSLHYTETESTFPQVFDVTPRQMLVAFTPLYLFANLIYLQIWIGDDELLQNKTT